MDHSAAGHSVIRIKDLETNYLKELNESHKSLAKKKRNLQLIESETTLLIASKDAAIKDMEKCIKKAQEELEQHRNELLDQILDHFSIKEKALQQKQKRIQEEIDMFNQKLSEAKIMMKTGDLSKLKGINENLMVFNEKTSPDSQRLDLGENYIGFDSQQGADEFTKSACNLGRVYSKGFLPSSVVMRSSEAKVASQVGISLEVCNHHGDTLPVSYGSFSVHVTDPADTVLRPCLSIFGVECTVTFVPQISGLHQVTLMFLGQKLMSEQTHIWVSSNNPVLKFGTKGTGNGTFHCPGGITTDNDDCLYVADVRNRLIQKFTVDGEFLSQFTVDIDNKESTTVDMALDTNKGLLFCMEILQDNTNLTKEKRILVFNFKGELKRTYTPINIINTLFIAINKQSELILCDIGKQCLTKVDKNGEFLCNIGNLKLPGHICISNDDSMIVPENANDCICIFNADGTLRHKFGSTGTGKGQLKQPCGVATDGEYILVGEIGNKRIQVFKNDGTFVSMIESFENPLLKPQGLAVTRDGHVFVSDMDNHCISKYKYKGTVYAHI